MNGIDLINGSGQTVPRNCNTELVCRSQMLTVWRRLHIEVDSMGAAQQNFIIGTTAATPAKTTFLAGETKTITVNPSPAAPLEANRFENGRLLTNESSFRVVSNTADTLTITNTNPRGGGAVLGGDSFQLFDDDDFNDDDGTNLDGDTNENIPPPDMSLLTANSDDINTNVFAAAYVRPVYDIVDPRDDSFFQANTFGNSETDIRPFFVDWDSRNTNTADKFWSVYLLGSYQHTIDLDHDPSTEFVVWGIVDAITGSNSLNSDGEGSGALIFKEVLRTKEMSNPSVYNNEPHVVAHEVGHLFSGQHTDGGLMGRPNFIR